MNKEVTLIFAFLFFILDSINSLTQEMLFYVLHQTKPHESIFCEQVYITDKDKVKSKTNQSYEWSLIKILEINNTSCSFDPKSVQMGFNILPHYRLRSKLYWLYLKNEKAKYTCIIFSERYRLSNLWTVYSLLNKFLRGMFTMLQCFRW